MAYRNEDLKKLLGNIDFGESIAETDTLLQLARVETSVLADLLSDRVDLVPGTKGSGKSALFRIFTEFLPEDLLNLHKVVLAHGVQKHGDSVFHVFKERFEQLDEDGFVDFWCIYFTSLVYEQFVKNPLYQERLKSSKREIEAFRSSCCSARIPEIKARLSLREILDWTLHALTSLKPKARYKLPENCGEIELDLFGSPSVTNKTIIDSDIDLPIYVEHIKKNLEAILEKAGLTLWLMIDRLDEIFPRRSSLERRALRGLLRTMRIFTSSQIRIKAFLRDDILDAIVSGGEGFTALSHVTARQADTLRWAEEDILTMIVKRLSANTELCSALAIDREKINASFDYRKKVFYKVFPAQVHHGNRQSSTLRWIYNHTADGNNVVTPRDVIDLLTSAKQHQLTICMSNPSEESLHIISSQAIQYGLEKLSQGKRKKYLEAEFPHMWAQIEKFISGKSDYNEPAIKKLLGKNWESHIQDLRSIGFITKSGGKGGNMYTIPNIYRKGLEITQGRVII